ncbi:MAG: HPr(Ser) kinase/phosphatase [Erysipelotrichaceae bacterium]|nr:HPr(Ser) kinase/phosphatase [Erysipelotrichaceae bacterium]
MANEELNRRVYVRQLEEYFHFEQLTGSDSSLDRWIIAPDVNRPGLELSGYLESNDLKRVVVLGTKEYEYMTKLDPETQKQRFEIITDSYTPCIIISDGFEPLDSLIWLANDKNFPVFRYEGKTYQLMVDLVSYLSEQLAATDTLHGVMMNIYGRGVMITGKSGIGKSELALDLINRGHMLVADDCIEVTRVHTSIICQAPKMLKRMLEIRGLGIVDVTRMFGANAFLNRCNLDFVINLVKQDEKIEMDRLNPINRTQDVLGLEKPMLVIPITEGKSLSVIIEAAVSNYLLKKLGFDSNEEFKQEYRESLIRKGEENDD